MKPEEVFTGKWSQDEDGFYHLLSGGIRRYNKKILSKLKTMRATAPMWINYDLPSLVEMSNESDTDIYHNAQLNALVKMNNKGGTYIYDNAQLNALVKMNNKRETNIYDHVLLNSLVGMDNENTYIWGDAQLPLLKKPKAKFVVIYLNGDSDDNQYGCKISDIKDWDSFYSELLELRDVTTEWFFIQKREDFELLSPDELLSLIKMSGV